MIQSLHYLCFSPRIIDITLFQPRFVKYFYCNNFSANSVLTFVHSSKATLTDWLCSINFIISLYFAVSLLKHNLDISRNLANIFRNIKVIILKSIFFKYCLLLVLNSTNIVIMRLCKLKAIAFLATHHLWNNLINI